MTVLAWIQINIAHVYNGPSPTLPSSKLLLDSKPYMPWQPAGRRNVNSNRNRRKGWNSGILWKEKGSAWRNVIWFMEYRDVVRSLWCRWKDTGRIKRRWRGREYCSPVFGEWTSKKKKKKLENLKRHFDDRNRDPCGLGPLRKTHSPVQKRYVSDQ